VVNYSEFIISMIEGYLFDKSVFVPTNDIVIPDAKQAKIRLWEKLGIHHISLPDPSEDLLNALCIPDARPGQRMFAARLSSPIGSLFIPVLGVESPYVWKNKTIADNGTNITCFRYGVDGMAAVILKPPFPQGIRRVVDSHPVLGEGNDEATFWTDPSAPDEYTVDRERQNIVYGEKPTDEDLERLLPDRMGRLFKMADFPSDSPLEILLERPNEEIRRGTGENNGIKVSNAYTTYVEFPDGDILSVSGADASLFVSTNGVSLSLSHCADAFLY
jgi:hypothetical protein